MKRKTFSAIGQRPYSDNVFADRVDSKAERDRLRALYWAQVNAVVNSPFTGRPIQGTAERMRATNG